MSKERRANRKRETAVRLTPTPAWQAVTPHVARFHEFVHEGGCGREGDTQRDGAAEMAGL